MGVFVFLGLFGFLFLIFFLSFCFFVYLFFEFVFMVRFGFFFKWREGRNKYNNYSLIKIVFIYEGFFIGFFIEFI